MELSCKRLVISAFVEGTQAQSLLAEPQNRQPSRSGHRDNAVEQQGHRYRSPDRGGNERNASVPFLETASHGSCAVDVPHHEKRFAPAPCRAPTRAKQGIGLKLPWEAVLCCRDSPKLHPHPERASGKARLCIATSSLIQSRVWRARVLLETCLLRTLLESGLGGKREEGRQHKRGLLVAQRTCVDPSGCALQAVQNATPHLLLLVPTMLGQWRCVVMLLCCWHSCQWLLTGYF